MKVRDLIEYLSQCDPDAECYVEANCGSERVDFAPERQGNGCRSFVDLVPERIIPCPAHRGRRRAFLTYEPTET
ncbi:MAG: hypothetical protein EBR82_32820, partial [Caulobacteraceae bacterium]|nr:hypothetical protein [Caulobacteraceae bacterium]